MTEFTIDQALQKGIEAHKTRKLEEADRFYTAILKAQPKHPDANHNMGVLAVGVGKVREALPFFKTALEANPAKAQFWLSYIDALIKLEKLADAKAVFDQAKSKGAKGAGFDQLEKRLNVSSGVPTKAVVRDQKAEQTQPQILDTLKLDEAIKLANRQSKEGSPEEAMSIYQEILVKFPKNKRAAEGLKKLTTRSASEVFKQNPQEISQNQVQSVINLYNQGQLAAVVEEAQTLTQQYPEAFVVWNLLGAAAAQIGKLDQAVLAFKKVITIKPDNADAYLNMGNALKNQGNLEEALQAYNKSLELKPGQADAYNNIGSALKDQGNLEEALQAYNKSLELKPDHAQAYNNIGNALKVQGKLEDALQAYKKTLEIKPDYAQAYYNMGVTLQEQGKLEEAIGAYNKALEINPDYSDVYNNKGIALKEQGKLEEAIEAYNKAIIIKPDNATVYSNIGNTLKDQGKLDEAIGAYNKALEIKPDYAEAVTQLAELLFELKLYGKAAELFALDNSPKNQNYLLKCLYELDEKSKFYTKLDDLIERGENNCVIGSFTSRAEIRYGIKRNNPFCNDPLKYVLKTDLTKKCDFKKIFVDNAANVLRNNDVKHKSQGQLTNGIQTAGNVFTQIASEANQWQNIIHTELKKYRDRFCESQEGFITDWPSDYRLYGWLVSMKSGGELSAHIHDTGWITGSIYINVPPKSKKDSGNLVVTTHDSKHGKNETKAIKSIDVVTGSLCFFPSSLLHYTIPFESDHDRIVLAFDIIPNK